MFNNKTSKLSYCINKILKFFKWIKNIFFIKEKAYYKLIKKNILFSNNIN